MSADYEDPMDPPDPKPAERTNGAFAEPVSASPYRNLWVPLVVVPFLVVGVIVLVYAFFGAIGGKEATLEENLDRAVHGGPNESQQALVSLASQLVVNGDRIRFDLACHPARFRDHSREEVSVLEVARDAVEHFGFQPGRVFTRLPLVPTRYALSSPP